MSTPPRVKSGTCHPLGPCDSEWSYGVCRSDQDGSCLRFWAHANEHTWMIILSKNISETSDGNSKTKALLSVCSQVSNNHWYCKVDSCIILKQGHHLRMLDWIVINKAVLNKSHKSTHSENKSHKSTHSSTHVHILVTCKSKHQIPELPRILLLL